MLSFDALMYDPAQLTQWLGMAFLAGIALGVFAAFSKGRG